MRIAIAAAVITMAGHAGLAAAEPVVGVSWPDPLAEAQGAEALAAALEAAGVTYLSANALASPAKQLADIESMIAQGADLLVVMPTDPQAMGPAVLAADEAGRQVVAYDRPIADPDVLFVGFDGDALRAGAVDPAELNRVARGQDAAWIWADPRAGAERVAQVAAGRALGTDPAGAVPLALADGTQVDAILIPAEEKTAADLAQAVDAGAVSVDALCAGVTPGMVAACP